MLVMGVVPGNVNKKAALRGAAGARDKRWQRPSSHPRTRRAAASRLKGRLCDLPRHGRSYGAMPAILSIGGGAILRACDPWRATLGVHPVACAAATSPER